MFVTNFAIPTLTLSANHRKPTPTSALGVAGVVPLCLFVFKQVAAGSMDPDAPRGGDSQEITGLKFKVVECQVNLEMYIVNTVRSIFCGYRFTTGRRVFGLCLFPCALQYLPRSAHVKEVGWQ